MHESVHERMHEALLRREAEENRDTLAALAPFTNFRTKLFIKLSITKFSFGNS